MKTRTFRAALAAALLLCLASTGCAINNADKQAAIEACVQRHGGTSQNQEYLRQVCANELQANPSVRDVGGWLPALGVGGP